MSRHGKSSIVVVALLALLTALSAVPAGASNKAVLGTFGTTAGGAGGQVSTGTGVAVNTTGAGGVGVDEVYVADRGNNRVDQFTADGDFVRAWGANVVAVGSPGRVPVNEKQTITLDSRANGGTFTLSFGSVAPTTTASLPVAATAAEVEAALGGIGGIGGAANIDVTGSNGGPWTVEFVGALADKNVAQIGVASPALSASVGSQLTCSSPTTGPGNPVISYQWLTGGLPSTGAGANTSTYTTDAADAGKAVQCQATAINTTANVGAPGDFVGSTQVSNPPVLVSPYPAAAFPTPPNSFTISGAATASSILTCPTAAWSGATSFAFQWYRNGVAIGAATASTYVITAGDVAAAAVFQCAVTGTNATGSLAKVSQNKATPAAPNPPGAPNPAAPPTNTTSPTASVPALAVTVATSVEGSSGFEVCDPEVDVCQAGIQNGGAGAVSGPESIAVDQDTGNVYVASDGNKRIDVFSATGDFQGAFGWNVDAGAPEDKLQFCTAAGGCQAGEATAQPGGLFNLSHAALAVDPSNGHLYVGERGSLRVNEFSFTLNGSDEVTGVGFVRAFGGDVISGGAAGTGTLTVGSTTVSGVAMAEKAFVAGQSISGPGIQAGTTIASVSVAGFPILNNITLSKPATESGVKALSAAGGAGNVARNEKQVITVNATGGNFKLNFVSIFPNAEPTTANIPYNASAAEVETALKALGNISSGTIGTENIAVTGANGGPWTVEFKGTRFADTNVAQLVIAAGSPNPLSDGSATVATTVEGTSPEVCTIATGCQAGSGGAPPDTCSSSGFCRDSTAGAADGFFSGKTPTGLAVDADGFIYAATAEGTCSATNPCRVQKFNPDGSFKEAFGPSTGGAAECQLTWTEGQASNQAAVGVAVDPSNQHVFVTRKATAGSFELCEFDSAGVLKDRSPVAPRPTNASGYLAPAVASNGNVYVNAPISGAQGAIYLFGPVPPPSAEISPASEIGQTTAKLNGKVTVPSLEGEGFETTYRFEYSGDNGLNWARAPFTDASVGSVPGTYNVSQVVTGLQPNLTHRFRLVAIIGASVSSPEATFTTLGAKPTITKTIAMPVGGDSAKLNGAVNPNNSPTTYHFEWGTSAAYGNEVPDFDAFTGAGGQPVSVGSTIKGLQLSTTYHFRIVATNASGTAFGPDTTFTTNNFPGVCPNEEIRDQQGSQYLPDCRAFEQVSPSDKRPVGTASDLFTTQLKFQASPDGSKIYYPLLNGLDDATAGGNLQYMASRNKEGWLSTQLSSPNLVHAFPSDVGDNPTSRILYNSPDLSCTILESIQPLTADTPAANLENGAFSLYRRNAAGSYTLLTPAPPSNSVPSANRYAVDWATPDCSHILFDTEYKFLSGTPASGRILYEWANGTLRLAGILPDGSVAPDAEAGGGNTNLQSTTINSLSSDGSRVFFTAISNEGVDNGKTAIFVSENGAPAVNISRSKNPTNNARGVELQGITPKGSHVFFLARYGLAPGSSSNGPTSCNLAAGTTATGGEGCDLYAYNVDTETLTDLSADTNPADTKGAGVIGMVDASDDGSHVYFAARGQLIPGQGNTQAQNLAAPNSAYNIYLNHNGQLSFVGVMTGDQTTLALGGSNLASGFEHWAADATPSGSHLLFVSKANVTGYASGGVAEAYRYSAAADSTVCVSCRTDGLPSVGNVISSDDTGGVTAPIAYKGSESWGPNNPMSHRPRAISDDGSRVFFTMPDALAPGAVSGAPNIYEWEGGKVYLLAAGTEGAAPAQRLLFADSSASGDHAFFTAKSRLVPQDFDTTRDLYVARVGGGFPYEPPAPPCDIPADECQDPPTPQPGTAGAAPSEAFSGPANAAAQPASKKKRGKKRHKKRNKHAHKRQAKRNADNNRRAAR